MADFLDRVLSNRSPLIMGYSGWSGDVFVGALKRRLTRELPYNIYRFYLRRDELAPARHNQLPVDEQFIRMIEQAALPAA